MTANLPLLQVTESKQDIVESLQNHLRENSFTIAETDATRPWGAFLRVVNEQADKFVETFFGDMNVPAEAQHGERSPKILVVAPHARLSWQYHDRRSEVWRVVHGQVGVYYSETDKQPEQMKILRAGEMIQLAQGIRHRLVGLDDWGAIAEIWIHTDPQNPSNEDDNYRLQDDYSRS
jgi:mannose-6-phosphate isomerase